MAGTFSNSKLVDGYVLTGASYTTAWVDIASFDRLSVSVVFTGNSPTGTLTLQQSNDLQWTGPYVLPLHVGNTQFADDTTNIPAGGGQVSVSVSGAGAYSMNQYFAPYRWFRVVYTAIGAPVSTTLDVFFTAKA